MDNEHVKLNDFYASDVSKESLSNKFGFSKSKITIVLVFLIILIFASYFLLSREEVEILPTQEEQTVSELALEENIPFKEMTIPYLRSRQYESTLSELEQFASNANYTSYLTGYDSDGFKVNGLLTQPNTQMPEVGFPAIIFVHGYIPPASYDTTSNYTAYVDYLARNGFVVFKIDLRGHDESEGDANGAYYSGDYIVDVLSARSAISGLDFVDSKRIGVWGHSMAGNVAFRSFIAAQDIPAIVIWAGAVYTYDDWQQFGLNDNSYRPPQMSSERQRRREELFSTHGEFDSNNSFWRTVIPTNYLDGMTGAIQLNHSVDDNVVNIGYSRGLVNILQNTNINYELNEYDSGGHNISGSAFTQAMQNTVRFFRENL